MSRYLRENHDWVVPIVEFLSVVVALGAVVGACQAAGNAQATSDRLRTIEEQRRADEELEDRLATRVADFYSGDCDFKLSMMQFPLERWFNETDAEEELVRGACEGRDDGGDSATFVMRSLTVIGSPESSTARALVELSFFKNDSHTEEGRTAVEMTFEREDGEADGEFKITRMTEAIT